MVAKRKPTPQEQNQQAPPTPAADVARPETACEEAPPLAVRQWLLNDRLLLGACLFCALLLAYQLGVTVLQPPWAGPVTDALRAALAWPAFITVGYVSLWMKRSNTADARSWLLCSAALLSYCIARTLWSIFSVFIYHDGVPFPSIPDLFFVLQYPLFILAVLAIPYSRLRVSRLLFVLDCLMWIGVATILFWTFMLLPLFTQGGMSTLARSIILLYQMGDLFMIYTLAVTLLRPCRFRADRIVEGVLVVAFTCLIIADTWAGLILRAPSNVHHVYRTGGPPDLFWMAFYVLLPLASLFRFRLAQHEPAWNEDLANSARQRPQVRWEDVKSSFRFSLPLVAALLVSGLILARAAIALGKQEEQALLVPLALSFGLLVLVVVRQEVTYLENTRLRREREAARSAALVLQETTERMDQFIATAAHDLRTPIGAMVGYTDLAGRKCERLVTPELEARCPEVVEQVRVLQGYLDQASQGATRTIAVINRILASAQGQTGELELHPMPCDLTAVVRGQVDDIRMVNPRRTIRLQAPSDAPGDPPVMVEADADRIGQVVANYLTNALKYSAEDEPVELRVTAEGAWARVAVSDHGPGLPIWEQEHIWERFYRVQGIAVRSGTNIGLGLGLYVCKMIVERHGGQVGVESEVGSGSTFWFTLPLVEAPLPAI
jgi:signal transduction histidine kinase